MSEDWGFRLNWARMGDDRKELLKRFTGGREPTAADARVLTCFVKALDRCHNVSGMVQYTRFPKDV